MYVWRRNFRGVNVEDVKKKKGLEAENARLKKVLAELALEDLVLKEVNAREMVGV